MTVGRIGSIRNIGGVVNLGEIHGDVTASIDRSFAAGQDAELKRALLELATRVHEHAPQLPDAGDVMLRVRKLSEEAAAPKPDGVVVGRYLELITKAIGSFPVILDCVSRVRALLG